MKSGKFVNTNGIKLHLAEAGKPDDPCLVFLHGFPDFSHGWRFQAAFFEEKKFYALMPDQRGYNLSDKPKGIKAYELEVLARDIRGLLQSLGRRVWLVGHDWGGTVAWQVAQTWPELLHGLILVNAPHPEVFWEQLRNNRNSWLKHSNLLFYQIPGLAEKMLSSGEWVHFSEQFKQSARKGTITENDLKKYRAAWSQPEAFKSMLNWFRAGFKIKSGAKTTLKIEVPVLFLQGLKDETLSEEMVKDSLARCKNIQHITIPHAGHWAHLDQNESVNELMLEFILAH